MWRFMFFLMGVPMMILSFFEVIDVLPYVQALSFIVNGQEIEVSAEEASEVQKQIELLFESSRTMPAFGVTFDELLQEEVKDGLFVSMKFRRKLEVNGLVFDELLFEVKPEFMGVNLCRGNDGSFNGRCIYLDFIDKNMEDLYNSVTQISQVQAVLNVAEEEHSEEVQNQIQTETQTDDQNEGSN